VAWPPGKLVKSLLAVRGRKRVAIVVGVMLRKMTAFDLPQPSLVLPLAGWVPMPLPTDMRILASAAAAIKTLGRTAGALAKRCHHMRLLVAMTLEAAAGASPNPNMKMTTSMIGGALTMTHVAMMLDQSTPDHGTMMARAVIMADRWILSHDTTIPGVTMTAMRLDATMTDTSQCVSS
jgi:hypothetical protein